MDLATWQGNKANLLGNLAVHKTNPSLKLDIGELTLGARKAIVVYAASYLAVEGGGANVRLDYGVSYNDGANQLGLFMGYAEGALPESQEELEKAVTKDEFAAAAPKLFAAFGGGF